MPRKPIDYNKGLIYKFEKDGIVYYVGSTTNFTKRKGQHKNRCCNPNDLKTHYPIYNFIRNNGGWDEFKMLLIENYKCNDANELRAREQYWFNEFKPTLLNGHYPSRTQEQYVIDNKEAIAKQKLQYRINNKVSISKTGATYYIDNREAILKKVAQYNNDNKEAIKKRRREAYRAKHPIIEK